jgi:hypothetical protein
MAEDRVSDVNHVQEEDALKMEVTCLSKTSVNLYQTNGVTAWKMMFFRFREANVVVNHKSCKF